ncbi:MAG: endonuclease [Burkholderiales bacterium]|nr:endonuclease [Burkholderiales bacterium]
MALANSESLQHKISSENIANLPRAIGVYFFYGEGVLPLYIGKSIDIRARVMSHLRAPDEANMIAQTRTIDYIETAGEIGALLLESRLIKEKSPIFNQRLRRIRALCAIRLDTTERGLVPTIVTSKSFDFATTLGLYGLFGSAHSANQYLQKLAQQHMLCLSTLGLEKTTKRGCFGLQIKTCLGVCVGKEDRATHDSRLSHALTDMQLEVWPFKGAVDVVEEQRGWIQKHRIYNWCYLGTQCSKNNQRPTYITATPFDFDIDSYKILVKPIMTNKARIEHVETNLSLAC